MKTFYKTTLAALALTSSVQLSAQADPQNRDAFAFRVDTLALANLNSSEAMMERLSKEARAHCAALANRNTGQAVSHRNYIAACTRQLKAETLAKIELKHASQQQRVANK